MKFLDAFCGIGPWMHRDRLLPYQPHEILGLLDHFGIDQALVHSNFSADGGNAEWGNERLIDACNQSGGRFLPCLSLRPNPHRDECTMDGYLDLMRSCGSRSLWLVPSNLALWPWFFEEMATACIRHRIPVFFHRDMTNPEQLHQFCQTFPGLRIVLVGVGYGDDWWLYPLLRRFENLHVCLGHFYIPSHGPMRFLDHFKANRLIFGSGLPHFSPGGLVAHLMYADISGADRALIAGNTMEHLLNEVTL
ncbi:MAG: hypothetical protein A2269_04505 [Lentisphaerae bacterium RIFOXYA12_FULL_60_10]|nr:MAG: hypothetical protein A2269_04505 [Lentisphaerae bacterium RIFOXYA12_FULL_60_10]